MPLIAIWLIGGNIAIKDLWQKQEPSKQVIL